MMSEVWWQHNKATGGENKADTLLEMRMIEFSPYCEQSSNEHFCRKTQSFGDMTRGCIAVSYGVLFSVFQKPQTDIQSGCSAALPTMGMDWTFLKFFLLLLPEAPPFSEELLAGDSC